MREYFFFETFWREAIPDPKALVDSVGLKDAGLEDKFLF